MQTAFGVRCHELRITPKSRVDKGDAKVSLYHSAQVVVWALTLLL